jgi:UDP-N-acetylglucosamine 2-epimerase (non-hydrolysing)
MKKVISVVGARPNFMKLAPIHRAFQKYSDTVHHLICHTGQHYDEKMSKIFFEDLELPEPDFFLGIGSHSIPVQTAQIMIEFEKVLLREKPDAIIVVGDVNSTTACSITAVQMGIECHHIEAGLRSFDRTMPEEINRILTDSISTSLYTTEQSAVTNLLHEGVKREKIYEVGNVMIDSLVHLLPKVEKSAILSKLSLHEKGYVLVTLHRPANVDNKDRLTDMFEVLERVAEKKNVIFPMHPRTKKNLEKFELARFMNGKVRIIEPVGYIDFIALTKNGAIVLTDSGGIQQETTYLGVPCITLRDNTELPVTISMGTNILAGTDMKKAEPIINDRLTERSLKYDIPPLWDGKAAERIVKIIADRLNN